MASEIVDRGFVHHQAVARMWAVTAVEIADSSVLPFDIQAYAAFLNNSLTSLEKQYEAKLQQNNATFSKKNHFVGSFEYFLNFIICVLEYFRESVDLFSAATKNFSDYTLATLDLNNQLQLRRANDRLVQLERFFVDPKGLPDRPETK